MKAQAATEYLIMVGVGLLIITTIFYYTMQYSSESISINQAQETTETIAIAADYVYSLGQGSKTRVVVQIPERVIDSYVENNEIGLKVSLRSGIIDVFSVTKGTVSGNIPTFSGRHYIFLNMTDTGVFIWT